MSGFASHICAAAWNHRFLTCVRFQFTSFEMVLYVMITSSTAQGGGRSFRNRKPIGEVGCVTYGWQSESTDGPTGSWSCVFWSGCNGCSGIV